LQFYTKELVMAKATSLEQFLANPSVFTEINLSFKKIGDEEAIALSESLKNHSNLERLYLYNNQIGDEGAITLSEALKNLSKLSSLYLNNNQIGDEGAITLSEALKNLSNLQGLHLNNNRIGDEGVIALSEALKNLSNLQYLHLHNNQIGDEGAIALSEALKNHSNLGQLHLSNNQIGDEGAVALANAMKNHSNLSELYLNNNQIGDEGTIALSQALKNHSNLQTLLLNNNQIGDEGAVALANAMKNRSNFSGLYLNNNQIGDEGAIALSQALKNLSSLQYINLHNNQIGDEGAIALGSALKNHRYLNALQLNNNQIGDEGINALKSNFGKLGNNLKISDQRPVIQKQNVDQIEVIDTDAVALGQSLAKSGNITKHHDEILKNFTSLEEKVEINNSLDKNIQKELQQKVQNTRVKLESNDVIQSNQYVAEAVSNKLAEILSESALNKSSIVQLSDAIDKIVKYVVILEIKNEQFRVEVHVLEAGIEGNNALSKEDIDQLLESTKNLEETVTQLPELGLINSMTDKVKELAENDEFNTSQFDYMYEEIKKLQDQVQEMHKHIREREDIMSVITGDYITDPAIVEEYMVVIQNNPKQPQLYRDLGRLFEKGEEYEKAIKCYKIINDSFGIKKCYKKLLNNNPDNPDIMMAKADHFASIGVFNSAVKYYNHATGISLDHDFKNLALYKIADILDNQVMLADQYRQMANNYDYYNFEMVTDEFVQELMGNT